MGPAGTFHQGLSDVCLYTKHRLPADVCTTVCWFACASIALPEGCIFRKASAAPGMLWYLLFCKLSCVLIGRYVVLKCGLPLEQAAFLQCSAQAAAGVHVEAQQRAQCIAIAQQHIASKHTYHLVGLPVDGFPDVPIGPIAKLLYDLVSASTALHPLASIQRHCLTAEDCCFPKVRACSCCIWCPHALIMSGSKLMRPDSVHLFILTRLQ